MYIFHLTIGFIYSPEDASVKLIQPPFLYFLGSQFVKIFGYLKVHRPTPKGRDFLGSIFLFKFLQEESSVTKFSTVLSLKKIFF